MNELLITVGVMAVFAVMLGMITRLIATWMLNKTIRQAIKTDPASVSALADKLEQRQPWADLALGWVMLALTVLLGIQAIFANDEMRRDILQTASVTIVVGVTILVFGYVQKRRGAR